MRLTWQRNGPDLRWETQLKKKARRFERFWSPPLQTTSVCDCDKHRAEICKWGGSTLTFTSITFCNSKQWKSGIHSVAANSDICFRRFCIDINTDGRWIAHWNFFHFEIKRKFNSWKWRPMSTMRSIFQHLHLSFRNQIWVDLSHRKYQRI